MGICWLEMLFTGVTENSYNTSIDEEGFKKESRAPGAWSRRPRDTAVTPSSGPRSFCSFPVLSVLAPSLGVLPHGLKMTA